MATEAKTSTRKASPARKASSGTSKSSGSGDGSKKTSAAKSSAPRAEARAAASANRVAEQAAQQLAALCGQEPEGVTGLERTEDGWTVLIDVVELRRVPDTTDVLATYEVEVDTHGDLLGYHRVSRFVRGAAGGDGR